MSEVKAKKGNLLTIEKELLSSYIEAVADMDRIIKELCTYINWDRDGEEAKQSLIIVNETKNKHVDRIKFSGIWEA